MSIAGMRELFAAALNEVNGVQGYEYRPDSIATGDAWPVRGVSELEDSAGVFVTEWFVQICMDSDERTADKWIDDHVADVVNALRPVAYVDGFTGITLATGEYALQLRTRSE